MSREQLVAMVLAQATMIERLEAELAEMRSKVAELEARLGSNSGNSSTPPSRDPAIERQRQAQQREERQRRAGGAKHKRGKQKGAKGFSLEMSANPDVVVDHLPDSCEDCGESLCEGGEEGYVARQVVDIPEVTPTVTEHRAHRRRCSCGHVTAGEFPADVRAPVSYGTRVRAIVAYLLARQHLPGRRVAESMADLFGLKISTGSIDAIYSDASRRLGGFIAALVALLKTLPVLHVDETSDRLGTKNCWMHVVSTGFYTLIHASVTRGPKAIDEAGVLRGFRGVIVHDRLAMYWKLKAKHAICGAHLVRDLAKVAVVATQTAWATGLAKLLVEINGACDDARTRGLKALAPAAQRAFAARYDALVAAGLAANPDPPSRERDYYQRKSFNLVTAFATHRKSILRYMYDLQTPMTNNQGERDLRPTKLHRKISGLFRSQHGAERFAHLRSYLSTTRKNGISAITALVDLFEGKPWMPPLPT
ncbi:MAG TPA: IS66 family transposase [Candidatus Saccharimonadales bacterium]|nr:IS66 family transposase [Candidatus Saccharimonadales bacterium]